MTDERIFAIARLHQQYEAASKVVTLRGPGILEFARALLLEAERDAEAAGIGRMLKEAEAAGVRLP